MLFRSEGEEFARLLLLGLGLYRVLLPNGTWAMNIQVAARHAWVLSQEYRNHMLE